MDDIEKLAMFGNADWAEAEDLSTGAANGVKLAAAAHLRARRIVDGLEEKRAEIDSDKTLTDEGKKLALARAVSDANVQLDRVREHREKLKAELDEARAGYQPNPVDEVTAAAIWSRLPSDTMEVESLYRNAVAAGDWRTAGAIEQLPVAFDNHLPPERIAALKAERLQAEAPEVAKAIADATDHVDAVDRAYSAASGYVTDLSRDLPKPDPDSALSPPGGDGLRQFSDSGFAEAIAAE